MNGAAHCCEKARAWYIGNCKPKVPRPCPPQGASRIIVPVTAHIQMRPRTDLRLNRWFFACWLPRSGTKMRATAALSPAVTASGLIHRRGRLLALSGPRIDPCANEFFAGGELACESGTGSGCELA